MAVTVAFGATPGTAVTVSSDTQLTVTAPAGAGVVDVTVTTSGGSDTLAAAYTYVAPVPTLADVTPDTVTSSLAQPFTVTGTDLDRVGGSGSGEAYLIGVVPNLSTGGPEPFVFTGDAVTQVSATELEFTAIFAVEGVFDLVLVAAGDLTTPVVTLADAITVDLP